MKITVVWLSVMVTFLLSCSQEELSSDSVVDIGLKGPQRTELDEWIMTNYTIPYGIDVVYRWDKNVNLDGTFSYPPSLEKVKPVLETLKALWIDLYTSTGIGGENFFLGKNPLKIYLYGGSSLDVNGVEMIGNPQTGSLEMSIYHVDDFDSTDKDKLFVLMRSVHHQFAKRLADVYPYNRDKFLKFSDGKYMRTTDFLNRTGLPKGGKDFFAIRDYAMKKGFCTLPAMVLPDDDFAEMTSVMLMYNPRDIEKAFTHASVKAKKQFIEDYYTQNVKMSFRKLQIACIKKMNAFQQKNISHETD